MNTLSRQSLIGAAAIAVCTAVPAGALALQSQYGGSRPSTQWEYSQRSDQRQQQQMQRQQPQQQRDPRYVVDPEGWVRIAYDYDQDDQVDAVEWIFEYDLERARASSRRRMRQGQQPGDMMMMSQRDQWRQQQSPQQPTAQIEGEIRELRTVTFVGAPSPHVLARVETNDGRIAKVDLGPRDQIHQFNFQTGDHVSVRGYPGTVNQQGVLMARMIRADGRTARIEHARFARMTPAHGEILELRNVESPSGTDHLFATLRLRNGRITTIDLGPKDYIEQRSSLDEGDRLAVLATPRQTRSGNWFLQAQRLNVNGESINVAQARRSGSQFQTQGDSYYGFGESQYQRSGEFSREAKTLHMTADHLEFSPAEITCKPGETVKITLVNRGNERHGIAFDLPNTHPSLQRPLQPDASGTITFTAPNQPGTYTFYCPVADHAKRGMTGTLTVRSASSPSSSSTRNMMR